MFSTAAEPFHIPKVHMVPISPHPYQHLSFFLSSPPNGCSGSPIFSESLGETCMCQQFVWYADLLLISSLHAQKLMLKQMLFWLHFLYSLPVLSKSLSSTNLGNVKLIWAIKETSGKETKCPSIDEWTRKREIHTHTEYNSAIKKNEISPFATTWMDLEGIILSEVRQNKYQMISLT